jgi:hypothetical protein
MRRLSLALFATQVFLSGVPHLHAQSIAVPWSGHGHDAQHSALSPFAANPMGSVHWQTQVDLMPHMQGYDLLTHYGSPLITRQNTVLISVKTGAADGFRIEAHSAVDGSLLWTAPTGYSVPAQSWIPECELALTPANRLYYPDAGGTVSFRDGPDSATPPPGGTGQIAFYGIANYNANPGAFNSDVKICTPLTADRYGDIFFGFQVLGTTTPALTSGIARIASDGTGAWVSASGAAGDAGINEVVMNCAPALSDDHKTLYIAVSAGDFERGYLLALDSRTLATVGSVRLKDLVHPMNDAMLTDEGTASPMIGPDGDVYYGVLENPQGSNHYRGWLLHFDKTLATEKIAGDFGWDDTPSVVPSSLVSSYKGSSPYLLLTKYNNYAEGGGGGQNKIAILDPNAEETDPQTGATVMNEVISVLGPTPDPGHPGGVYEWCVNTVAIDPFGKCAPIHSEDGHVYRWDFTSNTLTQNVQLTSGLGESYTPSVIGVDGTVYVIAGGILYAVGP